MEVEGYIGQLALVGDVWYQIMAKQFGEKEMEYRLYSLSQWIPESWIKDVKSNQDFINA